MTVQRNDRTPVTLDQDIVAFLKVAYFGAITDPIEVASRRAYRDMNRTLRLQGATPATRWQCRQAVLDLFYQEIPRLTSRQLHSQEVFDRWHYDMCRRIKSFYAQESINFTYGQAQKWLNMTIKYLYMLEYDNFEAVFPYLHVPLDNIVFDVAKDRLNIPRPTKPWSRWDSYDKEYLPYQKAIKDSCHPMPSLRWEYRNWLWQIEQTKTKDLPL